MKRLGVLAVTIVAVAGCSTAAKTTATGPAATGSTTASAAPTSTHAAKTGTCAALVGTPLVAGLDYASGAWKGCTDTGGATLDTSGSGGCYKGGVQSGSWYWIGAAEAFYYGAPGGVWHTGSTSLTMTQMRAVIGC